jgi:arylformamidase
MTMFGDGFSIIDISQPISSRSACFPGDVPFSKQITVDFAQSQVINLTALTMSPHVGTHTDSPLHIMGNLSTERGTAADLPLEPFVGPVVVIDLSPSRSELNLATLETKLDRITAPRVLFKTLEQQRFDVFETAYAHLSVELVNHLHGRGVKLIGLDTPSADHTESKTLPAHHALVNNNMSWLENLDLSQVDEGEYFLIALPLKFTELEASPVRAVLLKG